jgi:glycosyltransferase involved in cell wall biosynthesis
MMTQSTSGLISGLVTDDYSPPAPATRTLDEAPARPGRAVPVRSRVIVDGVHLSCDGRPFRVRGVTYGSFLPRADGVPFPVRETCRADLTAIADAGLNVLRTYTVPPPEILELAAETGLRVLVGLQYHDWRMLPPPGRRSQRQVLDAGRRAVDEAMRRCAGHPEVLAIAVGNEVPADLVRLYGIGSVEEVLAELIASVHAADPGMLATYVNFPTTEFLDLTGQDLACFNVFLERPADWRAYLRHLQVVAGDRPLVVTECGLASAVHGEAAHADALAWQLRLADEAGVGVAVFSWTDEWGVGGRPVTGWGFGLTTEDRRPKPAAGVVSRWARRRLCELRSSWPPISVVVCAHNEAERIEACLESLERCDYPSLEVIVCDDGSSDSTLEIARRSPFQVLALPHGGLSTARNAGLSAARGEIVAYLDADAQCHPDWPYYLALAFEQPGVVAVGGPNLPVPGAGFAERVVSACPGGPMHVLLTDDRAEHVPGCNLAVRRDAMLAAGGFDEVFTAAGDDVDACWKLLDRGGEVAFAPAAQVMHHRRATFRGYLRQQYTYGRSERMVADRHPHRFNRLGQARWRGFIYGGQRLLPRLLRPVVYHGVAGSAPFQPTRLRTSEVALWWVSALLPLLALPIAAGLVLAAWFPWGLGVAGAMLFLLAVQAGLVAIGVRPPRGEPRPVAFVLAVGVLHVVQPLVRAWGRLRGPRLTTTEIEPPPRWQGDRQVWIGDLERALANRRYRVRLGEPRDAWDLRVSRNPLVAVRATVAVAWRWLPIYRLRLQPQPLAVLLVIVGAVLAGLNPVTGLAVVVATLAASGWGARTTFRDLRAVVAETTEGLAGGLNGGPAGGRNGGPTVRGPIP